MYQDRIALAIFYRDNVDYDGLACPYVYSQDAKTGAWQFEAPILVNLHSEKLKGEQTIALKAFTGKLLIAERESETSFIDEIYVTAEQRNGERKRLEAVNSTLEGGEAKYHLILKKGRSRIITFKEVSIVEPIGYSLTAHGYYIPDNPHYVWSYLGEE
jgi:hypothetical protein